MSRLGISVLNGLPILSVDEVIERIDAVDVAALRELAGELFVPERLSVACVGPDEEAFRAAIEPLGGLRLSATVGDPDVANAAKGDSVASFASDGARAR